MTQKPILICPFCTTANWPQKLCYQCGTPLVIPWADHRATVDAFNQRLIDRTRGLLDLVQAQALEIAHWRCRHRDAVREMLAALAPQVQKLQWSAGTPPDR